MYDDFNRITGVKYDDESAPRYEYAYNANGQVAYVKNNLLQQVAESEYDLSNRPCRIKTHKFTEDAAGNMTSQEHVYTGEVAYDDAFGRLSKFTEKVGDDYTTYATQFGYDDENRPTSLDYGDHGESTVEYDGLGRVAKTTVKAGSGTANETVYTYVAGAALETEAPADADDERKEAAENAAGKTSTTGLVETMTQTGGSFTYEYDDNGNITRVVQDGVETAYTYDALGQLTQVDDEQENATWVYEYDQGGNILTKKKYALGVTTGTPVESKIFTYGNANWRDQLTAVNDVGISYDAIGNPLNDGTWTYTWENGRQLKRMQSIDTDASFVYNENGLRVQKTVNGVVTNYTLHGKNVVHMKRGNDELHFFYDAQNKPTVVVYNGVAYSYVKNLQGDIVAILDSNKNVVVKYVYDAWGRPISKTGSMAGTLGTVQPFRYRGYVYDEETGMHYLRSRYYSSDACRFISADAIICKHLIATNSYQYCRNNAINFSDSNGFEELNTQFPYSLNATKMKEYVTDWWSREARGLNPKYNSGREDSHCAGFMSEMLYEGGYPTDEDWFYDIKNYLIFKKNNSSMQWVKSYGLYSKIVEDGWKGTTIKDAASLSKAINTKQFGELSLVFFFSNEHANNPWHVGAIGNIDEHSGNAFYYAHTTDRDGSNPVDGHNGLLGYINPDTESYVVIFKILE